MAWTLVWFMTPPFLQVMTNFTTEDYTVLYLQNIVKFNGVPISIISDRGIQF